MTLPDGSTTFGDAYFDRRSRSIPLGYHQGRAHYARDTWADGDSFALTLIAVSRCGKYNLLDPTSKSEIFNDIIYKDTPRAGPVWSNPHIMPLNPSSVTSSLRTRFASFAKKLSRSSNSTPVGVLEVIRKAMDSIRNESQVVDKKGSIVWAGASHVPSEYIPGTHEYKRSIMMTTRNESGQEVPHPYDASTAKYRNNSSGSLTGGGLKSKSSSHRSARNPPPPPPPPRSASQKAQNSGGPLPRININAYTYPQFKSTQAKVKPPPPSPKPKSTPKSSPKSLQVEDYARDPSPTELVPDFQGHYLRLGIRHPRGRYLVADLAAQVDLEIKSLRLDLALKHHTDLGGKGDKLAVINAAYENIRDLTARQRYHATQFTDTR
ncbi:hypothetical protein BD324DRAFT_123828 [Kockovaella imperatae]|uniref:J domain-containing protein n=1 Tax=Kockovaella imperatae TaxID=4999 RepID=A0A1Y1UAR3_9TREE|nr:hypothetical protein BD324DRAFT_123828 [Kockovaella imperatae]ORX34634.1 hypothetical protein BD324DRAFT_123828 [Kockovaella imperatae]